MREVGLRYETPIWNDPKVDWSRYSLVIPRTVWDYADYPEEFKQWIQRVESVTKMANPSNIIRWNMDKHYL